MSYTNGSHMVTGLQERAARGQPAEHVEHVDGWWLRLAPNCPWWVGTVLPHGDAGLDEVACRVRKAEDFYSRYGLASCFQISPKSCADSLDAFLEDRGYIRGSRLSLQAASTVGVLEQASAESSQVRVDDRPTGDWFGVSRAVHRHGGESDLLARVDRPSAYVSVLIGTDVIAVGRAVVDSGWAGVFGMATLPQARGKGAAREVLAALAGWAHAQAADHMYLQVECENDAAVRLYARVGFEEVCGYHYRAL